MSFHRKAGSGDPFELVLTTLSNYQIRTFGPDRARARCPAHQGSNRSALSIGRGDNGAVLLKCWAGCDVEDVVKAMGLSLSDLFPPKGQHAHPSKRRRLISANQALAILRDEIHLCAVAAGNLAHGVALSEADRRRLIQAAGRIGYLSSEVAQ